MIVHMSRNFIDFLSSFQYQLLWKKIKVLLLTSWVRRMIYHLKPVRSITTYDIFSRYTFWNIHLISVLQSRFILKQCFKFSLRSRISNIRQIRKCYFETNFNRNTQVKDIFRFDSFAVRIRSTMNRKEAKVNSLRNRIQLSLLFTLPFSDIPV